MLLQDYTQEDVKKAIKALKKHKAHGTDGIPEEEYKEIQTWSTDPLTRMVNEIKTENDYHQSGKTEQ